MRVLIAEDNECLRELLAIALHGYEVIVAEDGEEAVGMAECYQPDIILMDMMMPRLDGFGALERLKADEATADIPVVLMSAGCVWSTDVERTLDLGAEDYLKKPFPFKIHDLPKVLEGYIAKKKVRAVTQTSPTTSPNPYHKIERSV